ncbi:MULTISPECIES: hypothetical protein [unclassified Moorena]|uniref:hypothetical protein n=1 Tax=unclassified Moorena TaxID=2683338 RepID=UPI0013BAAC58|nr:MULTISPECIES: hypothetical protein [unclassified Moorena]NEQ08152.1 hypothetical protein [Moorena sp. SIO4E2]NEQ13577.1 hypothetical protein [Moorena sp. SIO3E2]NES41833.1 hypothetical protein [Moorena sp. SIO2C4]
MLQKSRYGNAKLYEISPSSHTSHDSRLPTPDSRFPIPDSRFPIPHSPLPIFKSTIALEHKLL